MLMGWKKCSLFSWVGFEPWSLREVTTWHSSLMLYVWFMCVHCPINWRPGIVFHNAFTTCNLCFNVGIFFQACCLVSPLEQGVHWVWTLLNLCGSSSLECLSVSVISLKLTRIMCQVWGRVEAPNNPITVNNVLIKCVKDCLFWAHALCLLSKSSLRCKNQDLLTM